MRKGDTLEYDCSYHHTQNTHIYLQTHTQIHIKHTHTHTNTYNTHTHTHTVFLITMRKGDTLE